MRCFVVALSCCLAACVGIVDEDDVAPASAGDVFPDVARVALPSSFTDDGAQWALTTGDEIFDVGTLFYQSHDDDYDMLLIFTERPVADIFAFSIPLVHEGPGLSEVIERYGWTDMSSALAGSAGALQHVALMNDHTTYENAAFSAQDILVHEVGHRWSAYLFLPADLNEEILVDSFWSHWSIYANVGGPSALGYGHVVDEGAGVFSFHVVKPLRYSTLELYQQGLVAPDAVTELFYVEGANGFDPPSSLLGPWGDDSYGQDVRYTGTRRNFTIEDVIARNGAQVPTQTVYRMAFVLVCGDSHACDATSLAFVDEQRVLWVDSFAAATGGRASVDTAL